MTYLGVLDEVEAAGAARHGRVMHALDVLHHEEALPAPEEPARSRPDFRHQTLTLTLTPDPNPNPNTRPEAAVARLTVRRKARWFESR